MRAIFSSFGRRANVDRRESPSQPLHNSKSSFPISSRDDPHLQPTFSSIDNAGRAIGDAPPNLSHPSKIDHHHNVRSSHGSTASVWASKLSGSLRATPNRRNGRVANHADTVHAVIASSSSSSRLPSHPPSSYREPSSQNTHANASARHLVSKFSASSIRRPSPSSAPSSHHSDAASQSRLKHLSSSSNLGSPPSKLVSAYQPLPSADANHSLQPLPSAPILVPCTATSAATDISAVSSAELASRLNQLAVANADGLLTDGEYHTLRQAVFDRMMQADSQSVAAPTANALTGHGLPQHVRHPDAPLTDTPQSSNAQSSTDLLTVNAGPSMSSLGHRDPQPSSIHSGTSGKASSFQNVTDLFRKAGTGSKPMHPHTSQDSHSSCDPINREASYRALPTRRDSEGVSSQLSSGDGHSQRALSIRTHQSSAAKSSRVSTLGRLRAASLARRAKAETAARDMEEAVSAERTARSLRAVSLYDAGSADLSNLSGSTYDRSPTSLRAEMAPSTMFGAEYVDKSSSEIQAEIAVVQTEGNRMLATFASLAETLLARQTALEPYAISRVVERVRDTIPLACILRLEDSGRDHSGNRIPRPPTPSSYRTPRQASISSGSRGHDTFSEHEQVLLSPDIAAFEAELTSIYTQKAAVVKRYQDRLGFLQSKLRSATIREGLK
ncbi:uncharacterized protein UTRI_05409_B [Ustilago trichophora]|uniref:Uncharacterized protein n=1 Tax=Ustilago trichophora TaxID=86804 RepID=A0A5C3EJZ1_9BASI|nr:uncharacterized protein UTRI_05409_B [Ustilago trichophora]